MNSNSTVQKVLITGGTGFIGTALCDKLIASGYHLMVLTRQSYNKHSSIQYINSLSDIASTEIIHHCINLAGEPLFSGPWTSNKRKKLFESRIGTTRQLIELNKRLSTPFLTLLSGSAIGYYGNKGQTPVDETAPPGSHLGAQLCDQWETVAKNASDQGTRVCFLRTGIVLGHGGALTPMKPLFKLGLGSPISSGNQYWPWISLEDMVLAILFLIENTQISGPVNLCSPQQVTNKQFSKTLADTLKKPIFLPGVPAWLLKAVTLGSSNLLTDSVKLVPKTLMQYGFQFKHPRLSDAMARAIYRDPR